MCGNFGLLQLPGGTAVTDNSVSKEDGEDNNSYLTLFNSIKRAKSVKAPDLEPLDQSLHDSMHETSRHGGGVALVDQKQREETVTSSLLPALSILRNLASMTEYRGGQAGGISTLEYSPQHEPICTRVRCVARKRYTLADRIISLHNSKRGHMKVAGDDDLLTAIGHTRFATSSINVEPELHPHEFVPTHHGTVWSFDTAKGAFESKSISVVIHITHNGDFDGMESYHSLAVIEEVGIWLQNVLHLQNNISSDSHKLAGCMDLFRVQGRFEKYLYEFYAQKKEMFNFLLINIHGLL